MTASVAVGTVSPWKCGAPELTGTSGVAVVLAHFTSATISLSLAGLTTNQGRSGSQRLSSLENSSKILGSSRTLSSPTMAANCRLFVSTFPPSSFAT